MVRVSNSTTSSPYLSTSSTSTKQSESSTMTDQMRRIEQYFDLLDGTPKATENFQENVRRVFHPDVVIEYPGDKDNLSYSGAMAARKACCDQGGYADLEEIVDNGDGTATMTVNNHIPGGPKNDVTRLLVHFKEGKVVRIRPIDPDAAQFGESLKRMLVLSNKDVADKHAEMLACFDGSPGAYAKAEPIINEIFGEDLVIEHGEATTMNLDDFKTWVKVFDKERNVVILEKISSNEDGIRVTARNIVGGVEQGPNEQVGVIKNGKIVYWSAAPANETGFSELMSSVAAQSDGMLGNIQRVRDYLAALDGSPNAWEQFEPHIDRVLARDIVWEDGNGAEMCYDEIVCMIRDKYIPNGCYPVLESVEDNGDGSLTVVINNHLPGEDGDATRQVLYYGDDDRIHRLTSASFADTCNRVRALPSKDS